MRASLMLSSFGYQSMRNVMHCAFRWRVMACTALVAALGFFAALESTLAPIGVAFFIRHGVQ